MDNNLYIILFLLLAFVLLEEGKKEKIVTRHVMKRKKGEEKIKMRAFANQFIGKKCYIHTINSTFECVIKEVSDNAILLETKNSTEVVNLDYVLKISEVHKQKRGK